MIEPGHFPTQAFSDVLDANAGFVNDFDVADLDGVARRGLAIVTCMDSRINPLPVVGMTFGDAKILRNAGARVTEDVLRTLVLATYLLGVNRVLVMPHTQCRMATSTEAEIHEKIYDEFDVDTRSLEFRTTTDQLGALATDVGRIRAFPLIPPHVQVGGMLYDVVTGHLTPIDC